jgi:hypothetical protein
MRDFSKIISKVCRNLNKLRAWPKVFPVLDFVKDLQEMDERLHHCSSKTSVKKVRSLCQSSFYKMTSFSSSVTSMSVIIIIIIIIMN